MCCKVLISFSKASYSHFQTLKDSAHNKHREDMAPQKRAYYPFYTAQIRLLLRSISELEISLLSADFSRARGGLSESIFTVTKKFPISFPTRHALLLKQQNNEHRHSKEDEVVMGK